ncbi:hypothetical protein AKJ18_00395 [Vibrio xuii]|nr:hypothetical protein AKJ18_00395 [Vibrio xuii]
MTNIKVATARTQAATKGNINKVQSKIDTKLEIIKTLINDREALRKENITEKLSLNWFTAWTSENYPNALVFSKSGDTYKVNQDVIKETLTLLDNARKALTNSNENPKKGTDYKALYDEMLFRNKALTADLLVEEEAKQFWEEEMERKNAVITDQSEQIDALRAEVSKLRKLLQSSFGLNVVK